MLKLSISLSLLWLFYQLLLRRLTFYTWNRWYFLAYALLSFFIPLVNISPMLHQAGATEPTILRIIPAIGEYGRALPPTTAPALKPAANLLSIATPSHMRESWISWDLALILVFVIAFLLLMRSVIRWISLWNLQRKAVLIMEGRLRIYQVNKPINPFSFGSAIYINPRLHTAEEWEEIILHEYVHVRQSHTIDVLLTEFICVVAWYNPFAWLIRHSVRQNLEFIADQRVIDQGGDRKRYQYHLVKMIGEPRYHLANNFNLSSLKKRIIMMNKFRSARLHLVKFLFMLPLLALLLLSFRHQLARKEARVYHLVGFAMNREKLQPLPATAVADPIPGQRTKSPGKRSNAFPFTTVRPARDTTVPTANAFGHRPNLMLMYGSFLGRTVYILDGVKMPADWKAPDTLVSRIKSISIKAGDPVSRPDGTLEEIRIVDIITNNSYDYHFKADHAEIDAGTLFLVERQSKDGKPAVIGSGRPNDPLRALEFTRMEINVLKDSLAFALYLSQSQNPVYLMKQKPLGTINLGLIESVRILSAHEAMAKFDEMAREGAVVITTKEN
jgi:hypothetical protein